MDQVVTDMKEFEIHLMETIGLIVLTHSHLESVIDPTNRKAPIYRKFVKRREKTETTKCQETSTQVKYLIIKKHTLINFLLLLILSLN